MKGQEGKGYRFRGLLLLPSSLIRFSRSSRKLFEDSHVLLVKDGGIIIVNVIRD